MAAVHLTCDADIVGRNSLMCH